MLNFNAIFMKNFGLFFLLFVVSFQLKAQTTTLNGDYKITGSLQVQNQLDILNETPNAPRTVLARLTDATALDVRSFNVTPAPGKLFSIGTTFFYGNRNTSINFWRGAGTTGGFITMDVFDGHEICKFSHIGMELFGTLRAREVIVASSWADHVFAEDYQLPPLDEVKQYITENKHLPGIPAEAEVKEEGVSLGDMQVKLLQKIEELTLYVIRQQEMIDELKDRIGEMENERK